MQKSSTNTAVIGEMGRVYLKVKAALRVLKYWLKIVKNKNSLSYKIYNLMREDINETARTDQRNWANNVKIYLYNLGLGDIWIRQDYMDINYEVIKRRVLDNFLQKWRAEVTSSSKL